MRAVVGAGSSVGPEHQATNLGVGGSSPPRRAMPSLMSRIPWRHPFGRVAIPADVVRALVGGALYSA